MSDFFGKLKSGAGKVAFEADKMARLNRAQNEQGQLKKQIEAQYMRLGEMVYHQYPNQAPEDPAMAEICQNVVELEKQVSAKGEEIQRINAESFSQGAPAPAPQSAPAPAPPPVAVEAAPAAQTKFCTNCGREMAASVKFCPDCGTKMA